MPTETSKLRIIAGKFRGRKIFFNTQNTALRPTLNRVRETLFNWLSPYIVGAKCLDLFAGSGIFSFEALSRGAYLSFAVEQSYDTYKNIIQNKINLKLSEQELKVVNQDALLFLKQPCLLDGLSSNILHNKFNIVFLDPPYNQDSKLLLASLNLLINNGFLQSGSKIYFECNQDSHIFKEKDFPKQMQAIKASKAGKVYFYLIEVSI